MTFDDTIEKYEGLWKHTQNECNCSNLVSLKSPTIISKYPPNLKYLHITSNVSNIILPQSLEIFICGSNELVIGNLVEKLPADLKTLVLRNLSTRELELTQNKNPNIDILDISILKFPNAFMSNAFPDYNFEIGKK